MKTQSSVSQKIRILQKINKTKHVFKQKCQASEKYVHFHALNIYIWVLINDHPYSINSGYPLRCTCITGRHLIVAEAWVIIYNDIPKHN